MPRRKRSAPDYSTLVEQVRAAGVVGMGGAGFPTHLKLRPRLDTVVINGAECEPLLACDQHLLRRHPALILEGAARVAETAGAGEIVLAVKKKNADLAAAFESLPSPAPLRIVRMDDVYPSGDEFFVIRAACGRVLPSGAIPVDHGIFVGNAATFKAVSDAGAGIPLTHRFVTVCGAVNRPVTVEAPIGAPFGALLAAAGGPAVGGARFLEGGVLMGELTTPQSVVRKTTSAVVVLPGDHPAILERSRPLGFSVKLAEHICCQCVKCTELCSRNLLGHAIEPHKAMRLIGSARDYRELSLPSLWQCSGCGLCSLVACPFDLGVRRLILEARKGLPRPAPQAEIPRQRAEAEMFMVPTQRLIRHLRLGSYNGPNVFAGSLPLPERLWIPCKQHAGMPARPVVEPGQDVRAGELIARAPDDALGAHVHSPAAGRVISIGDEIEISVGESVKG
jgi:Na+-translocating ferredoxin:NAD+ oxidoreductase RnfC subunit